MFPLGRGSKIFLIICCVSGFRNPNEVKIDVKLRQQSLKFVKVFGD